MSRSNSRRSSVFRTKVARKGITILGLGHGQSVMVRSGREKRMDGSPGIAWDKANRNMPSVDISSFLENGGIIKKGKTAKYRPSSYKVPARIR